MVQSKKKNPTVTEGDEFDCRSKFEKNDMAMLLKWTERERAEKNGSARTTYRNPNLLHARSSDPTWSPGVALDHPISRFVTTVVVISFNEIVPTQTCGRGYGLLIAF